MINHKKIVFRKNVNIIIIMRDSALVSQTNQK